MADVTDFLDQAGVDFDMLVHTHTVRAADEAAALGIDAEEVAKTLILIAERKVHLATEDDLARDDADFELGAVPPFGGREDQVLVDDQLAGRDSVVVEAGSHDRSVRLKAADLVRLTSAQVVDIRREAPTAF
jgi:prolyl-tRNA editing enzyme YbaK/EbsC (Cys-tRNA(Pro) deacylase)